VTVNISHHFNKFITKGNNMRNIRELLAPFPSYYLANKFLGLRQSDNLERLHDLNAKVDDDGQVWIKTGKPIEGFKL
jgi:hypothetical protein